MKFFGGLICVTSNNRLDFSADPDDEAGTGIFKGFYHCEIQAIL